MSLPCAASMCAPILPQHQMMMIRYPTSTDLPQGECRFSPSKIGLASGWRPACQLCQRRSGESARSAVISAVSACGNDPIASTEAFSRACCSVRIPGNGMIDGSRANR